MSTQEAWVRVADKVLEPSFVMKIPSFVMKIPSFSSRSSNY